MKKSLSNVELSTLQPEEASARDKVSVRRNTSNGNFSGLSPVLNLAPSTSSNPPALAAMPVSAVASTPDPAPATPAPAVVITANTSASDPAALTEAKRRDNEALERMANRFESLWKLEHDYEELGKRFFALEEEKKQVIIMITPLLIDLSLLFLFLHSVTLQKNKS